MEKVFTSRDVKVLDENAKFLGVSPLQLMENAGRAVAEYVSSRFSDASTVCVVCGTGNNGGDGFVAARHLARKFRVRVIVVGSPKDIETEEARRNYEAIASMPLSIELLQYRGEGVDYAKSLLSGCDVIVDAILGVGVRGAVREPARSMIIAINEHPAPKVAVDVPSGIDADTGAVLGAAVKASATVTFHAIKKGMLTAKEFCGEIIVADIGVPKEAEVIVGPGDLKYSIPRMKETCKKGDKGRILVVGGSKDFTGAPALAALAALKGGADLAIVVAPRPAVNVVRSFSPDIICVEGSEKEYLGPEAAEVVSKFVEKVDAVLIGPGLGLYEECTECVKAVIDVVKRAGKKLVIDADAIKALAKLGVNTLEGADAVVTPHHGEFRVLTGIDISRSEPLVSQIEKVVKFSKSTGVKVLLKGPYDIIASGERYKVNITGNPAMSVGGTGDVLAGLTTAFSVWAGTFMGACLAAYVTGLAGDLALKERGSYITASDVIEAIPKAISLHVDNRRYIRAPSRRVLDAV